jgi:hypothetical protein
MAMRITLAVCVWAYLVDGGSAVQVKPDFSGKWVLTSPADVSSNAAQELAITQESETPWMTVLVVERRSKDGVRSERYKTGVRVSMERREGPNTRLSVKWDADSLVVIRESYFGRTTESRPDTEREERWSIIQGMLVMMVTDRGASAEERTARLVYQKR